MKHLRRGAQAVLHLDAGGPFGDDILVLRGDVRITPNGTGEWLERFREPFVKKYDAAIANFGMPLDKYGETYSTLLEFTPTRVIAWGA
ncbi:MULTISPECIES: hypothetical protein [unclassified Microbacterium]|uniref:hypothetical protein n=1 Tax=unclassified Microbacterium TaxID=2609290 RepID=UPI00214CC70B|nr:MULTISPECIES: hypothetical protein [unclassified Microbacterium]MCR2784213.1 hypothetical protein [Microbacterium sp. zg.B96]WIM14956.1 hypothetical protein QNO11_10360 [Microbacterium sp. zg-B96]